MQRHSEIRAIRAFHCDSVFRFPKDTLGVRTRDLFIVSNFMLSPKVRNASMEGLEEREKEY